MSSSYKRSSAQPLVSTVIREGIGGYISRTALENKLFELFGRKIDVVVSKSILRVSQVEVQGKD